MRLTAFSFTFECADGSKERRTFYAATKTTARKYAESWAQERGLSITS